MTHPSLVQELETAMILQQLGQKAVYTQPQPAMQPPQEAPRAGTTRSDRRTTVVTTASRNRKRKLSYSNLNTAQFLSIPRAAGKMSSHPNLSSLTRSVSPGTDLESCMSDISSSCGSHFFNNGLCAANQIIKPLEAPPKLGRMPMNASSSQPPSGIYVRMHNTPPKKQRTSASQQFNFPSRGRGAQAQLNFSGTPSVPVNRPAPTFTNKMIVQLMSNPIVFSRNMQSFPLCQQTIEPASARSTAKKPVSEPSIDLSKVAPDLADKKIKVCRMDGCEDEAARRTPYCKAHCGQRRCEFVGCVKCAQGRTRFCIGHGGGRRCQFEGCTKGARDKKFCASHGGGRRCNVDSCSKLAVGKGKTCTAHGGGRRCESDNCTKSAQSSSSFCVRHGGGRKCTGPNCIKVARGKKGLCMSHASQHDANSSSQK